MDNQANWYYENKGHAMQIQFHNSAATIDGSALILGMFESSVLATPHSDLEPLIEKSIKADDFKAKAGAVLEITAPVESPYAKVLIAGLGPKDKLSDLDLHTIGGAIAANLIANKVKEAVADLNGLSAEHVAVITHAANLRGWTFDKYFTTEKTKPKRVFETLHVAHNDIKAVEAAYTPLAAIADGVFMTRDVVSELPNFLYPETFCDRAKELRQLGVEVEFLGEDEMRDLGMHSLLAVGQGSVRESKLCILRWNGGKSEDAPLAFVGKGVTFDTGGISIKPSNKMHEMKYDMAGAGVVLGLMKALASRKAKTNVVCVAGLAENMPSGNAQRPGDVWTTMSGQTIECQNTDAEGRMVLADALWYTQDRFNPKFMINLATLTGAIVVALGEEHAGLFSNNDELSERLFKLGMDTGEKVWRMPMGDAYDKAINSTVADMKNVGNPGTGGSITAAQFLQRFVNKVPWAHLDIAGVAWADKSKDLCAAGASGFGVRLLDRLVSTYYEG